MENNELYYGIYRKALEQMKQDDISHHASDLYLRKNAISEKLVNEYQHKENVTTFIDQIDHVLWYDIPFQYYKI